MTWDIGEHEVTGSQFVYIAVGGNTGSGKTTFLNSAAVALSRITGRRIVPVDERHFHHPLLTQMFRRPNDFAFTVQLNFALQRAMYIKYAKQVGAAIIIERSHFDDLLFMKDHFAEGHASEDQFAAYEAVRRVLWSELPAPDLYVRLRVPADVSTRRILDDEQHGRRPREFPSDQCLAEYVSRWFEAYERFFLEMDTTRLNGAMRKTLIFDARADEPLSSIITQIAGTLRGGGACDDNRSRKGPAD